MNSELSAGEYEARCNSLVEVAESGAEKSTG